MLNHSDDPGRDTTLGQADTGYRRDRRKVSEPATSIASAVAEQGTATQEIARNVMPASQVTQGVSGSVTGVSLATQQTGAAAAQALAAAGDLSKNGEALRLQVTSFLRAVRVA